MRRPYIQYLPAFNGNRKQFGPRRRFPNYRVATLMKWLSKWLTDELTDECPFPVFDIFRCSPGVLLEHYYPFANIGERTKPVFVISHELYVDHHFDILLRAVRGKAIFPARPEFWIDDAPPKLIKKDGVDICYKTQFKLYHVRIGYARLRSSHISMDKYTPIMGNDPGADPSSLAEFQTFRFKHGRWSIFKIYRGRRYVEEQT
ncbi:hypothetical protein ACFX2J_035817 [Malus domestica]